MVHFCCGSGWGLVSWLHCGLGCWLLGGLGLLLSHRTRQPLDWLPSLRKGLPAVQTFNPVS